MERNKIKTVHVDRIKPAHIPDQGQGWTTKSARLLR